MTGRFVQIFLALLWVLAPAWLGTHWAAQRPWGGAGFSWWWFWGVAGAELLVLAPFAWRLWRRPLRARAAPHGSWPWWGWLAGVWLAVWWLIAWGGLEGAAGLRSHSFAPLWLGYILIANAWGWRRNGYCLLTDQPCLLLALFPVSSGFWWLFEYLNSIVGNWRYGGTATESALEYAVSASIAFSTVLPAVLSTRDLLTSWPALHRGLGDAWPVSPHRPRRWGTAALLGAGLALLLLPVWPNYLFPLVWVAPGMVAIAAQALAGERHLLVPLAGGDWRGLWLAALAGLVCGFFWEMWNWGALARWQYQVPLVGRFELFEMPLLGYGGYLPFGITCLAVASLVLGPRPALLDGPPARSLNAPSAAAADSG